MRFDTHFAYGDILYMTARAFRRDTPITIVEIGIGNKADSTKFMLHGLMVRRTVGSKLYSIDINDVLIEKFRRQNKALLSMVEPHSWEGIVGDSGKIKWDKPIDVLYIDGDHTYEGVKADFENLVPHVKEGGLIFMHDTNAQRCGYGVDKFFKEIDMPKINMKWDRCGFGIITKP